MRFLLFAIVLFGFGSWLQAQPLPIGRESTLTDRGLLSAPFDPEPGAKLQNLNQLIKDAPDNPEFALRKGVYLFEIGRTAEAIETFEDLRLRYPDNPTPYVNLAAIFASMGRLEEARQMVLIADSLSVDKYQTRMSLASINVALALAAIKSVEGTQGFDLATTRKIKEAGALLSSINDVPSSGVGVSSPRLLPPLPHPTVPSRLEQTSSLRAMRPQAIPPARANRVDRLSIGPVSSGLDAQPIAGETSGRARGSASKKTSKLHEHGLQIEEQTTSSKTDVLNSIESWASAWSRRDLVDYASHYSSRFKGPNGISRDVWIQHKGRAIERAKSIRVDVKVRQIKLRRNTAIVTINQRYSSDVYSDVMRKEMKLERESSEWKIISERKI